MIEVREPIAVYNKTKLSAGEYLEFEKEALEKHEYFHGEVFAMAGAGARHNVIFSNTFGEIAYSFKRQTLQNLWKRSPHPHPGKYVIYLFRYFHNLRGDYSFRN